MSQETLTGQSYAEWCHAQPESTAAVTLPPMPIPEFWRPNRHERRARASRQRRGSL